MADISISVNTTTDLFTINLDIWEWLDLQIWQNGAWVSIPAVNNGNIQFQYNQPAPSGPVKFKAVANQNINIENPPNVLFMLGPNKQHTYFAAISYSKISDEVHLIGTLTTFDVPLSNAQSGPLYFSQGRMTGNFNTTS